MTFRLLKNSKGFSLIDVIAASAILIVVTLGIMSTMSQQRKEAANIENKLAALELGNNLIRLFKDSATCTRSLLNLSFDSTRIGSTRPPEITNITSLFSSSTGTSLLAQVGQKPNPMTNILVRSIKIIDFKSTALPDSFVARVEISFDPGTYRDIRPVSTQVTLQTAATSPLNAKQITGCNTKASLGSYTFANCVWLNPPRWGMDSFCPAGKVATGMCGTGRDADCLKNGIWGWGSLYCCDMVFQ